MFIERR